MSKPITGAVLHSMTGLSLMPVGSYQVRGRMVANIVELPAACCPVSGNPKAGSTLELSYQPDKWVLEIYSLSELAGRFVGGFEATEHYPAERNMEGMVELIAQMCADALGVSLAYHAEINLTHGRMILSGGVSPS